jgi:hypothetical protein
MKTRFTFFTIIFVFAISAHATQLISEKGKLQFFNLKNAKLSIGNKTSQFKHFLKTEISYRCQGTAKIIHGMRN